MAFASAGIRPWTNLARWSTLYTFSEAQESSLTIRGGGMGTPSLLVDSISRFVGWLVGQLIGWSVDVHKARDLWQLALSYQGRKQSSNA